MTYEIKYSNGRTESYATYAEAVAAVALERHGMSKLTEADVSRIRSMLALDTGQRAIAREFGVHQCVVSRIKTGKRWRRAV